jgi:hypothetical protein
MYCLLYDRSLEGCLEGLRREVQAVKDRYQLPVERTSNSRRIAVMLLFLSIDLERANSRQMDAYGTLSTKERRLLDDQINKMIDEVENLHAMMAPIRVVRDPLPDRSPTEAEKNRRGEL